MASRSFLDTVVVRAVVFDDDAVAGGVAVLAVGVDSVPAPAAVGFVMPTGAPKPLVGFFFLGLSLPPVLAMYKNHAYLEGDDDDDPGRRGDRHGSSMAKG